MRFQAKDNETSRAALDDSALRVGDPHPGPQQRHAERIIRRKFAEAVGMDERSARLYVFAEITGTQRAVRDAAALREVAGAVEAIDAPWLLGYPTRACPHVAWLYGGGPDADAAVRLITFDLEALDTGALLVAEAMQFRFVAVTYSGLRLLSQDGTDKLDAAERALARSIVDAGGDDTAWPYGHARRVMTHLYDVQSATPLWCWLRDGAGPLTELRPGEVDAPTSVTLDDDGRVVPPASASKAGEA